MKPVTNRCKRCQKPTSTTPAGLCRRCAARVAKAAKT